MEPPGPTDGRSEKDSHEPPETRTRHVRRAGADVPGAVVSPTPISSASRTSINTTRQIAMLGIFAVGIAFVIITGGIDLSVGSVIGLTGVLIAKLSSPTPPAGWGYSLWVGIPVALAVALLIGLVQGLLITRLNLQPFIVTLGGMLLLRGVSQTIVRGRHAQLRRRRPSPTWPTAACFLYDGRPARPLPAADLPAVVIAVAHLRAALHRLRPVRLRDRRQPRRGRVLRHQRQAGRDARRT